MTSDIPTGLDHDGLRQLLDGQAGVVTARQLRELGARPHDVKRMTRRRDLVVVHPGVYVHHTGPPTWEQRAWAAVLAHWPAALTRRSALPDPPEAPLQVAIDVRRTVRKLPGVVVWRTSDLDGRVSWVRSPPRVRLEHAVIDLASDLADDPAAAFRVLADACQTRRTTAVKIAEVLQTRGRVAGRALLLNLLGDLAAGTSSVLEREWARVEQAHGLPSPERQKASDVAGHRVYRDAEHQAWGVLIELDGQAYHDNATARDSDARRDLEAVVEADLTTIRLTYGQVFRTGCATARQVGLLLQRRGWSGSAHSCPDCTSS